MLCGSGVNVYEDDNKSNCDYVKIAEAAFSQCNKVIDGLNWTAMKPEPGMKLWCAEKAGFPNKGYKGEIKVKPNKTGDVREWLDHLSSSVEFRATDPNVTSCKRVQSIVARRDRLIEARHEVIHFPWPMWSRDYCKIRAWQKDEKETIYIAESVRHPGAPENAKKYVRMKYCDFARTRKTADGGVVFVMCFFLDFKSNIPKSFLEYFLSTTAKELVSLKKVLETADLTQDRKKIYNLIRGK